MPGVVPPPGAARPRIAPPALPRAAFGCSRRRAHALDLRAFQARIAATFGAKDAARGTAGTYMYFIEEVGELAEALREPGSHDLPGEFADCLAWLASLAHLAGVDLAAAAAAKYPPRCIRCRRTPCRCRSKP